MIGRYEMPTQVEQVVYSGVGVQKPLRLIGGFEPPHATLSDPHWLMRELRSIVRVLTGVVDCIRDDIAMSGSVTPQLICSVVQIYLTCQYQRISSCQLAVVS